MLRNIDQRYGWMTKLLHWTSFVLIANQFVVAAVMLTTPPEGTTAGVSEGGWYNWHKSIGMVVFVVVLARFVWRKVASLPDWAPHLSAREKRAIHWVERVLYLGMFLMPISGFVFVMAGDFGVNLFSTWELPRVISPNKTLAVLAQWTHRGAAWLLGIAILTHWTIVARHQSRHRDRYVQRMLPFTHQ
jgi:cytochrome b561